MNLNISRYEAGSHQEHGSSGLPPPGPSSATLFTAYRRCAQEGHEVHTCIPSPRSEFLEPRLSNSLQWTSTAQNSRTKCKKTDLLSSLEILLSKERLRNNRTKAVAIALQTPSEENQLWWFECKGPHRFKCMNTAPWLVVLFGKTWNL